MIISLDTETTGSDFKHGCYPFLVTIGFEDGTEEFWEWDVDPKTRIPDALKRDIKDIQECVDEADHVVLQNTKFDVAALLSIAPEFQWNWDKVYDTLIAGHLINSRESHTLTDMTRQYLRVDVQPFEDTIKAITMEARRWAKSKKPDWMIAKKGLSCLPSVQGEPWKLDMWLPRAIVKSREHSDLSNEKAFLWLTACTRYANSDSRYTLDLFQKQREMIEETGHWRIYLERLKVLRVAYDMQELGVTLSGKRLRKLTNEYQEEAAKAESKCVVIAKKYGAELSLPKSGNNKSLTSTIFDHLKLPVIKNSKRTGAPSLDAEVMAKYEETLEGDKLEFIQSLRAARKRKTAMQYMEGYQRFWLPVKGRKDWNIMYPNLNPTGTGTLRWSSKNPNEQNISKQEGFNLRYAFGPLPEREWWSLDAKNIELRIPAYVAGEQSMIDLFEKPDEPPFYGSNHLLVFSVLHPDKYDHDDPEGLLKAKKKYESTWYKYTKSGNFAVQYGAMESSGTADKTYRVPGGQRIVQDLFKEIAKLNKEKIRHAQEYGYVETVPDRNIDPDRGYPVYCPVMGNGDVLPTVPLNYFVQSTAMWWMMKGMIRCEEYLSELNNRGEKQYGIVMQVHDELVFDFPAGGIKNFPKIRRLRKLMELSGEDLGIPTPVGIEYHANNWSQSDSWVPKKRAR